MQSTTSAGVTGWPSNDIFAAASPQAARKLVELIDDPDPRVATAVSIHILDRLLGKVVTPALEPGSGDAAGVEHLRAMMEIARQRRAVVEREGARALAGREMVIDATPSGDETPA